MPQPRGDNPFTPTFGGLPERFFGRADIIGRVTHALGNPQSPDAALFITGPRGCGKTALLERLSSVARDGGWLVIDVHSLGAVDAIQRQLTTREVPLEAKASPQLTLPGGVGMGLGTTLSTEGTAPGDLVSALVRRASSLTAHRGILITVDEVQKISEEDMEQVCAATQMARRKGLPVALMLAGLPGSKELIASYRGCTFMQRVEDRRLGGLLIDETVAAFKGLLALVTDMEVSDEVVWGLAERSQGYPYLIQLVGYHFVEAMREAFPVGTIVAQEDDVALADDRVYEDYRANVLLPSVRGLRSESREYLRAMAPLLDEEGYVRTGDVAKALGKDAKSLSSCRQTLIDRRLILPAGWGKVCYGLPHLSRFAVEDARPSAAEDLRGRFVPR